MTMRIPKVLLPLAALAAVATTLLPTTSGAATREYFLAAEDVVWDFAPSKRNLAHGGPIPQPWRKTKFRKTRYIEYTDGSFTTPKPQPEWLGVLGPIIRAEVGDVIRMHFLNRARGRYGIHPHGVRYDKDNEGAHYSPAGAGAQIPPGGSFTYTWIADATSGPGPADPSSIVWWYHSHVDEPAETNAGLLGPLVITAAGRARPDGGPADVDREFVLLFMIFDQDGGRERGLMHGINGHIFGNLQGLTMNTGDRVRWYMLGMGNEVDLHSPHWHGRPVTWNQRHTDVIELLPGSMATADMIADNPGTWLMHCHVADHIAAGMTTTYTIGDGAAPAGHGRH
jgi:FtsP/CotA-like multicopper oxidase with cupredoxin domain